MGKNPKMIENKTKRVRGKCAKDTKLVIHLEKEAQMAKLKKDIPPTTSNQGDTD